MTTVTAHAPGRVNLIGEHTDYNGGLCLPFAIALGTTASVTTRDDRSLVVASSRTGSWTGSLEEAAAQAVCGWPAYVAGVLWALQEAGWRLPGLDITIDSTLALGAGLSSSAALECAVATAIAGLVGHPLDVPGRRFLAEACRRAETEYVGAPTGGLDQLASMLGAEEHAVLIDFADAAAPTATPVRLPLRAAGLAVLVTDTRVRHALADGDGGYAQRRWECEAAAAALGVASLRQAAIEDLGALSDTVQGRRARHVVTENARVAQAVDAVRDADWRRLGDLMVASHASLRDGFEVTTPELDTAVEAALVAGARGARMTGGGFGGCTVALTDEDRVDTVRDGIDAAFAAAGHRRPVHHVVQPAAGAGLLN